PLLADRLGIAVWEEIPLYHYTPQTFSIAMDRGIPQQMLAEMDLRDMNRPSVLFHGFANESTGESERASPLHTLRALDRRVAGTRLTGQAAYGINPSDPTSANLDVAGYTMYYGVLYGGRLSGVAVQAALQEAHRTYPHKPIVVLEYGHWADDTADEAQQLRVFNAYYAQLSAAFDIQQNGMVSDFLVRLSIRSAMFAGAITGFVFGLFAGATLGALISWFAGAIVDWQAQLGFSLGVTQQLLPLGDQARSLESVSDRWFLVIPAVGLVVGVFGA